MAERSGAVVAVVCHSHPSISKGGAEVSAYALYLGLRELGVDAIFITACAYADRHRLAFADANEFAVYFDGARYDYFYHLAPRTVEQQLLQIIREQRVRVVNFHHFLNFGVNSLRAVRALPDVRCYFSFHEYLAICLNHGQMVTHPGQMLCPAASPESCTTCYPEYLRSQFAMRKSALLELLVAFDGFISPSKFLVARYAAWGIEADRISVIENGLQTAAPPVTREQAEDVWTFGYFGQINPFKGIDVILGAAEQLASDVELARSIRIRIHGNLIGQSPALLERFAKAQNLPFFHYAGPYNSLAVYRLMSACDYVVVPSKWWENSPVVIQEAFATRTPVICSGLGGLAEKVVHGVSGLHFKLGDSQDLLRTLKIAADATMADKLRAGIPPVSSAGDMARNYLRVFKMRVNAAVAKRAAGDMAG